MSPKPVSTTMSDEDLTREQLLSEVRELRARVAALKGAKGARALREGGDRRELRLMQFSVEKAADEIFWMDSNGRVIYVNDSACRVLGYSRDELLSMYVWDIDPTYYPEIWINSFNDLKKRGFQNFETKHKTRNGVVFPVEITANYIECSGKEYSFAYVRDITGRKQAEKDLRLAHFSINRAADEIILVEPDGHIFRVNEAACKALGYTRDELVTMYVWDIDPDYPKSIWPAHWQELKRRRTLKFESIQRAKDGRIFPTEVTVNYLEFEGKEYNIGIIRDITERKRAEEELKAAKSQAELYLDLMGHDINNMNQIALGYLEMVIDAVKDDEVKELVKKPLEAIRNSSKLIDNVRKLQKITAGGLVTEAIDVNGLLAELRGQYANIPGKDVTIDFAAHRDCHVTANALLKDVFSNLIDNAIKHSGPSKPVWISLGMGRVREGGKEYCKVVVEDDGPGIPDAQKEKLFARIAKEKAGSKGLGLYLVKLLVEDYHGSVHVEDRVPGDHTKGARFVVVLPAAEK